MKNQYFENKFFALSRKRILKIDKVRGKIMVENNWTGRENSITEKGKMLVGMIYLEGRKENFKWDFKIRKNKCYKRFTFIGNLAMAVLILIGLLSNNLKL